jgi:pyrroloquinoline quinone (PQQ) biosynthesis protein C
MSKYEILKNVVNEIETIINKLKNKKMSKQEIENYFWNNKKDIMDNYPFLVTNMIETDNRDMLNYMLENIRLMDNGIKTQNEADVDIGQKIVDDYVKPNLK